MRHLMTLFMLCAASAATAQQLSAQHPGLLVPLTQGEASPGTPQMFTIALNAGDVVSGTLELVKGGAIAFEAFDPGGRKLKDIHVDAPGRAAIGFAAATTATYQVRITRVHVEDSPRANGLFLLHTTTTSPAVRMAGQNSYSVVRFESPRIHQLTKELQTHRDAALSRFWTEVSARGGQIVEPFDGRVASGPAMQSHAELVKQHVLVTFLWRESYPTTNVLLRLPVPTEPRPNDYFMTRLPGSDVWYKSVLMPRGSRISYQLSPNHRQGDIEITSQADPLNPRLAWDDTPDISLLELEGAPDESWFRRTPAARGTVSPQQPFRSTILKGERPIRIYTPPGYRSDGGPYPLLLIFDGVTYVSGFEAIPTLDNLISAGRIRPVIACFLTSSGTRPADLGPNAGPTFGEALVRELLPWLRNQYRISTDPGDVVIGGYSAGGSGAARIALEHPTMFGNVLSQSGAFGSMLDTSALIVAYRDAARVPVRFYLDVGLFEPVQIALPAHELSWSEGLTVGNRHFRDVLLAKGYDVTYRETGGQHNNLHFRATLADALLTLLPAK
jgi:enterochelin esterase family protein